MEDKQKIENSWEIPVIIPCFLEGANAQLLHEEGSKQWENYPIVTNNVWYSERANAVIGSHPFYIAAANKVFRKSGLLLVTATTRDTKSIIESGLDLEGKVIDLTLVLKTYGDSYKPNDYIAKDLARQLGKRNIDFSESAPAVIQLTNVDIRIDGSSTCGLSFDLRGDAVIIQAEQIIDENNKKMFSEYNELGMPIFDKKGKRQLWTRKDGLSRVSLLGRGGILDASGYDLWASGHRGRVVLMKGVA